MTVNAINTYIVPTAANEVTAPSQPAFLAYLNALDLDKTGNGALYLCGDTDVNTTFTEVYDQNADFTPGSSTGCTFTAPVTGRYFLTFGVRVIGAGAVNITIQSDIITSNRSYRTHTINQGAGSAEVGNRMSVLADMDATDTATYTVVGTGAVGNTLDIHGFAGGSLLTYVSGYLVV